MKLGSSLIACGCLVVLSAIARAEVIIVDAAGGGAFTDIQPAVFAAQDGDTILVKPGSYSKFYVYGRSLTIVGDVGTIPSVSGLVEIFNIQAGQTVTLARMNVQGGNPRMSGPAIAVGGPDGGAFGAVRVVDCQFTGRDGVPTGWTNNANVVVAEARNVAFTACTMSGASGSSEYTCSNDFAGYPEFGLFGGPNMRIAAYDCTIRGGHGGNGGSQTTAGGGGLSMNGFLLASRCDIQGGHGGDTNCVSGCPSDGGDGLGVTTTWLIDTQVAGGAAGLDTAAPAQCPADPGSAFVSAPVYDFAAPSIGFSMPAVAREGTFVTVTFSGPPGAHVFLNDELTTTFEAIPSWRGVLLSPFADTSGGPARARRWGVIPSSGVLHQIYKVPFLPSGEQAQTRFLQAYRIGPNGITLGSFRTLTVLDSSL